MTLTVQRLAAILKHVTRQPHSGLEVALASLLGFLGRGASLV